MNIYFYYSTDNAKKIKSIAISTKKYKNYESKYQYEIAFTDEYGLDLAKIFFLFGIKYGFKSDHVRKSFIDQLNSLKKLNGITSYINLWSLKFSNLMPKDLKIA